MTETITAMSITGNELCVAGKHVYNHYTDCKDASTYLSEDIITDVMALPGEKVHKLVVSFPRKFLDRYLIDMQHFSGPASDTGSRLPRPFSPCAQR